MDSAAATPSFNGSIYTCTYKVSVGGIRGQLYLDVSNDRGASLFGQTRSSGAFDAIRGVGDEAAYNPEDGRFAVRDGNDYLLLTLPITLGGSTVTTTAQATQVGAAMAKRAVAGMR
ncbi:MAG: hypothetical protein ACR2F6_04105 [Mycobacteriales bacterium]